MGSFGATGPCHRCGRGFHLARDCSHHTCFRCNARGHMAWECVEGLTCSRCGGKGHFQRNCKDVSCHRCGRRGHIAKFCKDPFAKAAEMEKQEEQQALCHVPRAGGSPGSRFVGNNGRISTVGSRGALKPVKQKEAPSPWDNLGVMRDTSSEGKEEHCRGLKASDFTTAERVTVLSTKRKGAVSGSRPPLMKKRRANGANLDPAPKQFVPASVCHLEMGQPGHNTGDEWQGLVGYESEDNETEAEFVTQQELADRGEVGTTVRMESLAQTPYGPAEEFHLYNSGSAKDEYSNW